MKACEAIAFMGALRGLPLAEGRRRGRVLMAEHGLGAAADKPVRKLSKGMAQTVQLLGAIVHQPLLIVLRSEEHTSELQSIMRISYAVFCLTKKNKQIQTHTHHIV